MSVSGYNELKTTLATLKKNVSSSKFLSEATSLVYNAAVQNAPKNTGALQQGIYKSIESSEAGMIAEVYTNIPYATYVEFGTGPKGAAEHSGISPDVVPAYRLEPWWIHESMLDPLTAQKYGWPFIDTPKGRFYKCSGQAAQPFMYPALKDNEQDVLKILDKGFEGL